VRISAASEYKVQRNSISRFDNVGTSAAAVLLADGSRLGVDIDTFDLPAPYQSSKVQLGGRLCGDEIDRLGTFTRP
jgi:hypothetical protein